MWYWWQNLENITRWETLFINYSWQYKAKLVLQSKYFSGLCFVAFSSLDLSSVRKRQASLRSSRTKCCFREVNKSWNKEKRSSRKEMLHTRSNYSGKYIVRTCGAGLNRDVSIGKVRYCLGTDRLMIKFKVKINTGNSW